MAWRTRDPIGCKIHKEERKKLAKWLKRIPHSLKMLKEATEQARKTLKELKGE